MGTIASQITSLTIVYSTVYSDADQRKHKSSASLAFVRGIHRGKCFHLMTSSWRFLLNENNNWAALRHIVTVMYRNVPNHSACCRCSCTAIIRLANKVLSRPCFVVNQPILPYTPHYNDVITSAMASQITNVLIVYSTVCSGADQNKYKGSAPLAFVKGIWCDHIVSNMTQQANMWIKGAPGIPKDYAHIMDGVCENTQDN